MNRISKLRDGCRRLDVFAAVEVLLTLAALVLVAVTVGGQLGQMLGLRGPAASVAGWSIALVYDALWIGALRMSEVAIRQRSKVGIAVMLGLSAAAVGVSTGTLLILGHAQVFAGVPVAAALFMGLRLFVGNVLADPATAARIAEQSAADRNARALAAADARHLRSGATTDVVTETAEHLAEMDRQIARAEVLTGAQAKIDKARAKAEKVLAGADKEHGEAARAFMARDLAVVGSRPAVTAGGHTVVTQARPQIEPVTTLPVTPVETDTVAGGEDTAAGDPATLQELADVAGVDLPQPGVTLSDEQLAIVIRWLRYAMDPPRSYRSAQEAFRKAGFRAREQRVRNTWTAIEDNEAKAGAKSE